MPRSTTRRRFQPVEYFGAVAIWYLVLTTVWTLIQSQIERKLAVSDRGEELSLWERLTEAWTPVTGVGARSTLSPRSRRVVRAVDVHKRFGRLEVLKGVDLEVERGEVVCVIGPSGSGKSTLPPLHQPSREDRLGSHRGQRPSDRLPGAERQARRGLGEARSHASVRRSASSSSASTSSRTRPRSRTSSRRRSTCAACPRKQATISRRKCCSSRVGVADKRDVYPGKLSAASSSAWRSRARWR